MKTTTQTQPEPSRSAAEPDGKARPLGGGDFADNRPESMAQRKLIAAIGGLAVQRETAPARKPNNSGLPDKLKSGIESLSGMSMDGVKVHYNSSQPAQLNALAYAQGADIHVGPGQEKHLPHEAWHVVQQAQGRVKPTLQMKEGVLVNDDQGLEREADVMGERALMTPAGAENPPDAGAAAVLQTVTRPVQQKAVIQRLAGMEMELRIPFYGKGHGVPINDASFISDTARDLVPFARTAVVDFLYGGLTYNVSYGAVAGHYDISADHTGWRQSHAALRAHINGRHITNPGAKPSMTNLEYRTRAQEERSAPGEATMREIADEIRNHARQSAADAARGYSNSLRAPVADKYTGIPVEPLRALLHGDAVGLGLFNTMNNSLDPSVYYQTTVGSLPSEIPDLFNEAADDIAPVGANDPQAQLLRRSVEVATAVLDIAANAPLVNTFEPGAKQSLRGWMTLVAQYLLAWQLETTNLRYTDDGAGHLRKTGGTPKNLVPYLSKTPLVTTIGALPASVRPNLNAGPLQAGWIQLFDALHFACTPAIVDMVGDLGLIDYAGDDFHNAAGNRAGTVAHDGLLGGDPHVWLQHLIRGLGGGNAHIQSGNPLGLDAGQHLLGPELSIRGEQAIPLEDRATQSKDSFGDEHDIAHVNDILNTAWDTAKNRRIASTAVRTAYRARHAALTAVFAGYGTLVPLIAGLNALRVRLNALHANPDNLPPAVALINQLHADVGVWRGNNSDAQLALQLLTPLIGKANWVTKGYRLIGSNVVPAGVVLLRTELAAANPPATTLANLRTIGLARLAGGDRAQVTTNMYELVRDTPGWIGTAAGWTSFVTKHNTTNGGV